MPMLFGILAIILAILNVVFALKKKNAMWFRYLSLSLTALTVCALYREDAQMVIKSNWTGLMDITPALSTALWVCTIGSILVNSISLFLGKKN